MRYVCGHMFVMGFGSVTPEMNAIPTRTNPESKDWVAFKEQVKLLVKLLQ